MKKVLMIFSILILSLVTIILINGTKGDIGHIYQTITDINYSESLKELNNPERGFYEPIGINMQENDNKVLNPKNNLIHLRVGIGAFSSKVNGESDIKFTDNMLASLDQTLKNIKSNGGSVIIRFAYDNFNGTKDLEPSLEMILTHITQLKELFEKNSDVIAYVELGFFGPWGEMHSSKICTKENVNKAIDAMLASVPQNIKIGVRTPAYYASWANVQLDKLNENITTSENPAYRVGIYNDGYLGSESDLGTFKDREIETLWLKNQAMHTFYGGEVVANYASKEPLNTIDYIAKEGFITHTTYLNLRWNNSVIESWKNTNYNGEDKIYRGKSAFLYINNHLGYRFVLKSSKLTQKVRIGDSLKGVLDIENVGFGNLVNEKKVTIVLANTSRVYEISTHIDVRTWNSKELTEVPINVTLPDNIKIGEYKVYLRISQKGDFLNDNNYNCIEFANEDIWNEELGANYIGTINIEDKINTTTSSSNKTSSTTLTTKVITLKPSTSSTAKTTIKSSTNPTKPVISDDVLYVSPSDDYNEYESNPTTTKTTTSKANKTTTSKITKEQTANKTTPKKISTTSSSNKTTAKTTFKTNEEIKEERIVLKENNSTNNIKTIVVLLLIAIILFLIFLTHKNM